MPKAPPRRTRIRLDERVYTQTGVIALLTACTEKKRPLFRDPRLASAAAEEIQRLHGETWRILGYCVMPDHIHLLALNIEGSLADLMKRLKGRLSTRLRGRVETPIWQRSFHDHILRRNEDINRTVLYLLENPVRAGLVSDWSQYRWCGSMEWPNIDAEFFSVNPSNVIWSDVFARNKEKVDPERT